MPPAFRSIYLLGTLSLINDFSGDMVKPLLPALLATLSLGAGFLGAMEGCSNAASYAVMLWAGRRADRGHSKRRLTLFGYYLSNFARPFLVIASPLALLSARILDRVGKGMRTTPRDQWITTLTPREHWGRAFGVQRAFDHAGGLLGTAAATLLLAFTSISLQSLILAFCLPSLALLMMLTPGVLRIPRLKAPAASPPPRWRALPAPLKQYVGIIFLSALGTPSELFLILKMRGLGLELALAPLAGFVMILFTLPAAYLGGLWTDRFGARRVILAGWLLFVVNFLALAWIQSLALCWALLALFGFQTGMVEAAERSHCSALAPDGHRSFALGGYYFSYGLASLPGSALFGLIWEYVSPAAAFIMAAALSLAACCLLKVLKHEPLAARN